MTRDGTELTHGEDQVVPVKDSPANQPASGQQATGVGLIIVPAPGRRAPRPCRCPSTARLRAGEPQHFVNHVDERLGGRDLVIGRGALQRLGHPQVVQDALQLAR